MNTKESFNEISIIGTAKSYRKSKKEKWNKSLPSKLVRSLNCGQICEDECNSNCCGMLPVWFWSNYLKASDWQNKHNVALWKSYALGLQHENQYLVMEFQKQFPGRACNASLAMQNLDVVNSMHYKGSKITSEADDGSETEPSDFQNEEIQLEMSEEMIKFFEQSIKHKLEMKKLKEEKEECDWVDVEVRELPGDNDEREKEMKLLYGGGSSMIIGMETAIQLSFDKYCYLKSPKYWPNIPLNI